MSRTLFSYQITPQITTSVSPAELLKKQPRSKLDLLRPHLAERVERKQQSQKEQHDMTVILRREFSTGTKVWVRNMQRGDKWLPGTILSKEGSVTYHIEMSNGRVRKCHTDQLRVHTVQPEMPYSFNPPTLPLTSTTEFKCARSFISLVSEWK